MRKDLLVLLLLVLPSFAVLLRPGYFPMHDDLQSMRQFQLDKCFQDGQIPCRWITDMGYGYGYPLFNFYPPFPYFLGHVYRVVGLAYIDVVKAVGVTGFMVTALGMYLLGFRLWGRRGGVLSSLLYTYAPYHSTDFYVRGAMNEFWAMAFYPFIFYFSLRLIERPNLLHILLTSISLVGLMLSHNLMLMIFAPVFALWLLYWLIKYKSRKSFIYLTISGLWSVGLAAFFTLPVLLEQKFAHVETLIIGYFNYLAHFLDLNQIFFRINWNYGESIYGPGDTMSFALGYLQWLLPLGVILSLVFFRQLRSRISLVLLLLAFSLGPLFLSHYRSAPIWEVIKPLHFLQFPWRLLTVSVFSFTLLGGAIARVIPSRLVWILAALALLLNANYFRPREWFPNMTDDQKFSGRSWQLLVTSGIFDYLPIWAPMPPADPAGSDLVFSRGLGYYRTLHKNTRTQLYEINSFTDQAVVEAQTYYFPGWKASINDKPVEIDPARDKLLGRITVDVPQGTSLLRLDFTRTPVRLVSDLVSLFSWLLFLPTVLVVFFKRFRPL